MRRKLVWVVVGLAVIVGIVVLLRAAFLQADFGVVSDLVRRLGQNPPLTVDSLGVLPAGSVDTWGSQIGSSKQLPATKGFWLLVQAGDFSYVGELVNGQFTVVASLNQQIHSLRLFDTKQVLFTSSGANGGQDLWASVGSSVSKLVTLSDLNTIYSLGFDTTSDSILITGQSSIDSKAKWLVLSPQLEVLEVFSSSQFLSPQILASGLDEYIDFSSAGSCYQLQLGSKTVNGAECYSMRTLDGKVAYQLKFTGSIPVGLQTRAVSDGQVANVYNAGTDAQIADVSNTLGVLAFIKHTKQIAVMQPQSAVAIAAAGGQVLLELTDLPALDITDVGYNQASGFLLVSGKANQQMLWLGKQVEDQPSWQQVQIPQCLGGCNVQILSEQDITY